MRHLLLAVGAAAALAGCDAYNEAYNNSFRSTFRQASIDSCISASRTSAPPQARGWDWQRLCTCATDRLMAGKSAEELSRLASDTPEQRAAMQQCVAEVVGSSAPAPAVNTSEAPAEGAEGNESAYE